MFAVPSEGGMVTAMLVSRQSRVTRAMMACEVTRSDGSNLIAEVVTTTVKVRNDDQSTQAIRLVEPVVGPDGRFIEVELETKLKQNERGLRHAELGANGQVQLTLHGITQGFVFYYDLCAGTVPGVEASPKHWKIWSLMRDMRFHGKVAPAYPAVKIFHPEVIRRRMTVKRGVIEVDEAAMDAAIEALASSAADLPAAEQRRLVKVGQAAGMVPDDLDIEELVNGH